MAGCAREEDQVVMSRAFCNIRLVALVLLRWTPQVLTDIQWRSTNHM